jgi:hypothetical protein
MAASTAVASAHANACDLTDSTGTPTYTMKYLSNGYADINNTISYLGGGTAYPCMPASCFVKQAYDNITTKHMTQGTAANMPTVTIPTLSGMSVSGLGFMGGNGSSNLSVNVSYTAINAPYAFVAMAYPLAQVNNMTFAGGDNVARLQFNNGTVGLTCVSLGTGIQVLATIQNLPHATGCSFNSLSAGTSSINMDNISIGSTNGSTDNSGSNAPVNLSAGQCCQMVMTSLSPINGYVGEFALFQGTAMHNQIGNGDIYLTKTSSSICRRYGFTC